MKRLKVRLIVLSLVIALGSFAAVQAQRYLKKSGAKPTAAADTADAAGSPMTPEGESQERRLECLDRCLGALSEDNHRLILQYYQLQRGAQIEQRRRIAEEHGIPLNALRLRVHRLRARLEACVRECLSGPERRPTSIPHVATLQRGPVRL